MTQHFTIATDAEGVATITWDTPGKSMNVMSIEGFHQLDGLIDNALADDAIKGIVITSGKPGSFAGGMDLNVIAKMRDDGGDDPAAGIFEGIMSIHTILRKIERAGMDERNKGGKPIACVLPGTALGIGFEIPLACHRIFAADNRRPRSACPRSWSASSPAPAAPRGSAASSAPWRPRPSCSRASSRTRKRPRPPA